MEWSMLVDLFININWAIYGYPVYRHYEVKNLANGYQISLLRPGDEYRHQSFAATLNHIMASSLPVPSRLDSFQQTSMKFESQQSLYFKKMQMNIQCANATDYVVCKAFRWMCLCCISVTNLALRKPAWQPSTFQTYEASRAVDGNPNPNMIAGSCTHSNSHSYPTWGVDLQVMAIVYRVEILRRDDQGHGMDVTIITAWISNRMPNNMSYDITYPFPNFNGCTIEVWE